MDAWDSAADSGGNDHLIDNFTIAIPGTVSNCIDQLQFNSLTVQGLHGIGNLTLAYFYLTMATDPITSCSSANVPMFSNISPITTSKIYNH